MHYPIECIGLLLDNRPSDKNGHRWNALLVFGQIKIYKRLYLDSIVDSLMII